MSKAIITKACFHVEDGEDSYISGSFDCTGVSFRGRRVNKRHPWKGASMHTEEEKVKYQSILELAWNNSNN